MTAFFDMLTMALYISLIQNMIFTGGFGVTESIRMAAKPRYLLPLALLIAYFSVTVALVCRSLDGISFIKNSGIGVHALLYAGVLFIIYVATCLFVAKILKAEEKIIRRVGVAAFNTLVLAIPYINRLSAASMLDSVGLGLGAGFAFAISVTLINLGLKRINDNKTIPEVFKGTASIFIYVALLSLAFTGLSGRSLSL